jgi:tetratricopeptide (TPR) repeat protein
MITARMTSVTLRLAAALFLTSAAFIDAEVVVYLKGGGDPKRGDNIRYKTSTQEYVLTVGGVEMPLPLNSVERVEVPKPAAMTEAEKLMSGGQFISAMPMLEKIAADFPMLEWGLRAQELLADAYARKGDIPKSLATYSALFKTAPAGQVSVQARMKYWNALLAAQQMDALSGDLERAIAKGSREEAAYAQLMRGNLRRSQNKTQDALLDYLRTVLLFEDVAGVQPEAMFKAAEMMDALTDPRGSDLRKRLVQKYPDSEFARKAGAHM